MDAYKTKVKIKLQGTGLEYYSLEDSETVVRQLIGGNPVLLQTYDGQRVIVHPAQCPAIEVNVIVWP